eukprot:SAG31_NODE_15816_length_737_cov_1.321317_1_plen_91_part_10
MAEAQTIPTAACVLNEPPDRLSHSTALLQSATVGAATVAAAAAEEQSECAVCLDGAPSEQLLPCAHRFCAACTRQLSRCPLCRADITTTVP